MRISQRRFTHGLDPVKTTMESLWDSMFIGGCWVGPTLIPQRLRWFRLEFKGLLAGRFVAFHGFTTLQKWYLFPWSMLYFPPYLLPKPNFSRGVAQPPTSHLLPGAFALPILGLSRYEEAAGKKPSGPLAIFFRKGWKRTTWTMKVDDLPICQFFPLFFTAILDYQR